MLNLYQKPSNLHLFGADHNKITQTTIILNYFECPLLTIRRNKKLSIFCKTEITWSTLFWANQSHIICALILPNPDTSLALFFFQATPSLIRFSGVVMKEAVSQRCSVKDVFLEISQNLLENTCAGVSFLIKLQVWACNFIKKETLAQVFSCEFCKISKNTFS